MPLALLAFGLVSIALLIVFAAADRRSLVRQTARLEAVAEIERDTAISHLRLEEYLSGDEVDGLEVSGGLERCLEKLDVLVGTRERLVGARDLRPIPGDALHLRAAALAVRLRELRDLSERRLAERGAAGSDAGRPVGIDAATDADYDAAFADVEGQAVELRRALAEDMERRRARSSLWLASVVLAWSALIAAAAAALWNRERHRRRAEAALEASQERLLQSQKLEAVGRIAGGLAHDINNYLAAIRGHCELVRMKSASGSRIARKMDSAIRTVIKASSLIDRLLAFGHAQPIQPEVLSLNRIVEGIEKVLRPSVGERVRIIKRLARGLPNVKADPSQLEQVLVNLVVNARDAMPDGGEIVLETAAAPDRRVMFAVSDTGHGIAPEARDKIFEPFFTTKSGANSSGLGLATVFSIVQQTGGSIEVASEVGRGTRVEVFLPSTNEAASPRADAGELDAGDVTGSERILLVDDNPDFLESTRALLEALGYTVATAAAGEEALEIFTRGVDGFDLVVTDVVMPGISGRQLADRLREIRHDVPVIFMSGYHEDVTLKHGVERGDMRFLKKQFSSAGLARLVRSALETPALETPALETPCTELDVEPRAR